MGDRYDTIIIGGGLGGLVSACALLKKGQRVILLEKGHMVGGYQVFFKRKSFIFEPSVHITAETGKGSAVTQILSDLGISDEIEFSPLDPVYCLAFPDETITVSRNHLDFIDLLKDKFPDEKKGIDSLFDEMAKILRGLESFPEIAPIIAQYAPNSFKDFLDKFVEHPELKTIIGGLSAYFGMPLSRISCVALAAFSQTILVDGGYMPVGGVTKLGRLLEDKIKELGGKILLKSPADKIVIENNKTAAVVLENGEKIDCANVVSNADATHTFFQMVGEENLPSEFVSRIRRLKTTESAFCVFLGVKSEGLGWEERAEATLVFPDYDLERQYKAMQKGDVENANFCLGIPSKTNPSFAPPGHDVVMIFSPVPFEIEGIHWKDRKEEFTQRLINLADKVMPGLKDNIIVTDASTPLTLHRYTGNRYGAVGGWAYTPESDMLRPENKTPVGGLYLAGHWTFPGAGINNVIKSGMMTASMID